MIIEVLNTCGKRCKVDTDLIIKAEKIVLNDDVFYRLVTCYDNSYFIEEDEYNKLLEFYKILEQSGM